MSSAAAAARALERDERRLAAWSRCAEGVEGGGWGKVGVGWGRGFSSGREDMYACMYARMHVDLLVSGFGSRRLRVWGSRFRASGRRLCFDLSSVVV